MGSYRAGSSSGETGDTAYVRVQIVRYSTGDARRYRTHAHDEEKTAGGRGRRRGPHCGRTVLRPGLIIPPPTGSPPRNRLHTKICDRTHDPTSSFYLTYLRNLREAKKHCKLMSYGFRG